MKILKGRLHKCRGDLSPGETFLHGGKPFMAICTPAASKLPSTEYNSVNLENGIIFVVPKEEKVEVVEFGVTGLEGSEID